MYLGGELRGNDGRARAKTEYSDTEKVTVNISEDDDREATHKMIVEAVNKHARQVGWFDAATGEWLDTLGLTMALGKEYRSRKKHLRVLGTTEPVLSQLNGDVGGLKKDELYVILVAKEHEVAFGIELQRQRDAMASPRAAPAMLVPNMPPQPTAMRGGGRVGGGRGGVAVGAVAAVAAWAVGAVAAVAARAPRCC